MPSMLPALPDGGVPARRPSLSRVSALVPAIVLAGLLAEPARAQAPAPLALELLASGFTLPVHASAPRGDASRVFVCELYSGLIRIVKDGQVLPTPFLDLSGDLFPVGERGLLSLAFHPQYASNGRFFVARNDASGDLLVSRFRVSAGDPDVAAPSGKQLLRISQPYPEHNGGLLLFGPDGLLSVSVGDGGGPLDPLDQGQSLDTLRGKLLRLDVDQGGAVGYAVPADNPFVGVPGVLPEIYAYGLRNPWRFAIDPLTGDHFIGDVGADTVEEINVIPGASGGGQNFGWRCMEGTYCVPGMGCACPDPGFVAPALSYLHGPGCAVVGGFVYRGELLPGHQGRVFFGDYCAGMVQSFVWDGTGPVDLIDHSAELTPPDGLPLAFLPSFGLDGRGEPLLVHQLGSLYRLVARPDCDGDGVADADELLAGTAFDADGDGVPDGCAPQLVGSGLVAGELSWLWFVGAQPGQSVAFFLSIAGLGAGPCLAGTPICLGLQPFPFGGGVGVPVFGVVSADAEGAALLPVGVPLELAGLTEVAFQAVVVAGPASVAAPPIVLPVLP